MDKFPSIETRALKSSGAVEAEPRGFRRALHNRADHLQAAVEADSRPASCRRQAGAVLRHRDPEAAVEAAPDQGQHPAATAASGGRAAARACCWSPGAAEAAPASYWGAARQPTATGAAGSCWAESAAST